jgi:hypothetical protein
MLIVFGLIISTAALVEPHHRRSAPRVGFSLVIAPIGAIALPLALASIVPSSMPILGDFALVFGYVAGAAGGICLGLWLGARHRRHLINSGSEADDGADSDES